MSDSAAQAPVVESKFSVVKTVDSGPPVVMSKAARLLAKRAAAEKAVEAKTEETQVQTPIPAEKPAEANVAPSGAIPEARSEAKEPEKVPVEAEKPAEVVEKPAEVEQPAALKAQFNAIARAEKRIREDKKALDEERARFEAEAREIRELKAMVERDKRTGEYKTLDFLGIDVEDWAYKTTGREKPKAVAPEVDELRKEIQELKAFREQYAQQSQAQQYEIVKKNSIAEINNLLDTDTDRYAYTKHKGAAEAVFATIEYHFNQTGEIMPYVDAADLVESHFKTEAESYSELLNKFQQKQAPQGGAKPEKHTPGDVEARPKSPPQNNMPDRVSAERMTRDERRKRAAAILSGKSA